jgi:hypothetical protein
MAIPNVPTNPAVWKGICRTKSLPKVDMFSWTLAHGNIFSGENLKKRGLAGPTRCPLCLLQEETSLHLFLGCEYSLEVWSQALAPWKDILVLPDMVERLFSTWENVYPHSLKKKSWFKYCWLTLPKFIVWKIWLEHNARIFKGKPPTLFRLLTKQKL